MKTSTTTTYIENALSVKSTSLFCLLVFKFKNTKKRNARVIIVTATSQPTIGNWGGGTDSMLASVSTLSNCIISYFRNKGEKKIFFPFPE